MQAPAAHGLRHTILICSHDQDAATEEGIVYVETDRKSAGEQDIDLLLAKLQELPQVRTVMAHQHHATIPTQAAPLLKETLNDINWKDLEALRKIDAGQCAVRPCNMLCHPRPLRRPRPGHSSGACLAHHSHGTDIPSTF